MIFSKSLIAGLLRNGILLGVGVSLSSCGGDSSDGYTQLPATPNPSPTATATPTASTTAFIYLTDGFDTQYDAVWITVGKIVAWNGSSETVLADYSAAPLSVNLPTLKRGGLLATKASIPLDTVEIRVYVDGQARLVGLDGVTQTVSLARVGSGYLPIGISGLSQSTTSLALDFDLPNFTLVNGTLQPSTRLATQSDVDAWTSRHGEIKGTVSALSSTSMTVTSGNQSYTISLGDFTSYRSRASASWTPTVGQKVEVNVTIGGNSAQPTFQALSVHSEDLFDRSGDNDTPEVKGQIVAINGNSIRITVEEAEDIKLAGTVDVLIDGAHFTRGAASLLAIGQRIEAHLISTQSGGWQAITMEIEGARKTEYLSSGIVNGQTASYDDSDIEDRYEAGQGYAEVKGRIDSVSGTQVTLTLFKVERAGTLQVGSATTFDLASTIFTDGSLSCLRTGPALEIKGYLGADGSFIPSFAELDGPCGGPTSNSGTPAGTSVMEAKGRIVSIGANSFEIQVLNVDDWYGPVPTRLTVRYDATTFFEDLVAGQLATNLLVEVKGRVDNATMMAVKIERD